LVPPIPSRPFREALARLRELARTPDYLSATG